MLCMIDTGIWRARLIVHGAYLYPIRDRGYPSIVSSQYEQSWHCYLQDSGAFQHVTIPKLRSVQQKEFSATNPLTTDCKFNGYLIG